MKTYSTRKQIRNIGLTLMACGLFAASAMAQQASLTLSGGSAQAIQYNNTEWSLSKVANAASISSGGSIIWTVNVTKGATSPNRLVCNGFFTVFNSGSAPATIGNITVNLQRKLGKGNSWTTVASDIANATSGDAAVSANICGTASSEGKSAFSENAGSGSLEFYSADDNTIFSLAPQQTLAAGEEIYLMFNAQYNNTVLGIPAGESVRYEVIVTFGNSGGRGGSGASCKSVDINGNGATDADEANVRSVPYRVTLAVPVNATANSQVNLTDPKLDVTGTASVTSSDLSSIGSGVILSNSASYTVTASADSGDNGGTVVNTAYLNGQDLISPLLVGYNIVNNEDGTVTTIDVYYDFLAQAGVSLKAESSVDVVPPVDNPEPSNSIAVGEFKSFTQGGWGATPNGNNPAALLAANFATVYPNGVEVGIAGAAGYSMKFNSATAVGAYLPAGGTAKALTADLINPTTSSSGVFGGQVLALKLNVGFSAANVTASGYGNLKVVGTGTALDGMTVAQILAQAEIAIGGGTAVVSISTLNEIATALNEAVDNGTVVTLWAQTHLVK